MGCKGSRVRIPPSRPVVQKAVSEKSLTAFFILWLALKGRHARIRRGLEGMWSSQQLDRHFATDAGRVPLRLSSQSEGMQIGEQFVGARGAHGSPDLPRGRFFANHCVNARTWSSGKSRLYRGPLFSSLRLLRERGSWAMLRASLPK